MFTYFATLGAVLLTVVAAVLESCGAQAGSPANPSGDPTPTPAPIATAAPSGGGAECNNAVATFTGFSDPYKLITYLDGRPEKEDHPIGGWSATTSANEVLVVWTGSYIADPSYGGSVIPVWVDGKTGVWRQLPGKTVKWETPGGSLRITCSRAQAVKPGTVCIAKAEVLKVINDFKKTQPNLIYVGLDTLVNNNPTARIRGDKGESINVENNKTLVWVREGYVTGEVLALDMTEGKGLYLATKTGTVQTQHAYSGMHVCEAINPAADFSQWWRK